MSKKILFVIRCDSSKKHGGDLSLMAHFEKIVSRLGFEVIIKKTPFASLHNVAAVFSINIDRPVESYILAKRCKEQNTPFYLYTLHHPMEGVEAYLKEIEFKGVRGLISFLTKNLFLYYESTLSILRAVGNKQFRTFLYPKAFIVSYSIKFLINNSHLVVTGEQEKKNIEKDFKTKLNRYTYIPHVFSTCIDVKNIKEKRSNGVVVCAGRIEPRKNQINALEVAKKLPKNQFIFVGSGNPSAQSYFYEFKSRARNLQNVTIKDSVSIHELRRLLSSAEFFMSLSFFEVVSLTEVEAYLANCKMVVCKYSYLSDFIDFNESEVQFVSPINSYEAVNAIKKLSKESARTKDRVDFIDKGKVKIMAEEGIQLKFKKMLMELL